METKYGVIADIHKDPRIIIPAVQTLKNEGIDKLILNGDIGMRSNDPNKAAEYTAFILDQAAKAELETYFQPGSHEGLQEFRSAAAYCMDKHSNLVDVIDNQLIEGLDHDLLFLPGSDSLRGGEFLLGTEMDSGKYIVRDVGGTQEFASLTKENIEKYIDDKSIRSVINYQNINDVKDLIRDPEKTILVCHVPRKFDNPDTCVDWAYFAINLVQGGLISGEVLEDSIKQQHGDLPDTIIKMIAVRQGYSFRSENVGNKDLAKVMDETGIKVALSNHIHESSHRANDLSSNAVKECEFVDELFYNSGCLDKGKTGILTVKDDKVAYQNIQLDLKDDN